MRVLFVSRGNNVEGKQSVLILNQAESLKKIGVEIIEFSVKGKGFLGYFSNVFKIKKSIRENKIDIIHAHYGYCGIISYLAKGRKKVVLSLMGSDIIKSKNKNFIKNLRNEFLRKVTKFLCTYLIDEVIVKSESMLCFLPKNKTFHIIPNGVNLSKFHVIDKTKARDFLGLNQTKKIILFAADSSRIEKNFELAQAALNLLKNKEQVELVQVSGIKQYTLNLYYNAADVLILTSFYEGSPNVIKEGLACNKVIVSTNVGDVGTNMRGVENCFISEFDPKDVAKKLEIALTKEHSNGRVKILNDLDEESIARKIKNIYINLKT